MRREKNALNLNHENVVKTLEIVSEDSKDFGIIYMEFYKNATNLQNLLLNDQNFETNVPKIFNWAFQICQGVNYCHRNNILHLDLKPRNILVCEDGFCKICDFGNSVDLENQSQRQKNVSMVCKCF